MVKFDVGGKEFNIKPTDRVLFITGAGISVSSGLPTYFGPGGVYESDPTVDIYTELSIENLEREPSVIWDVLAPIYDLSETAKPNISHRVLAQIEAYVEESLVYTQQLDRLHHKAGSRSVVEIHGTVAYADCNNCAAKGGNGTRLKRMELIDRSDLNHNGCPKCPDCGDTLRPFVVPFGGAPDQMLIEEVDEFCSKKVDWVFIIGTQLSYLHMQNPVYDAHRGGSEIVVVNPSGLTTANNGFGFSAFDPTYFAHHAKERSDEFFSRFKFQ